MNYPLDKFEYTSAQTLTLCELACRRDLETLRGYGLRPSIDRDGIAWVTVRSVDICWLHSQNRWVVVMPGLPRFKYLEGALDVALMHDADKREVISMLKGGAS